MIAYFVKQAQGAQEPTTCHVVEAVSASSIPDEDEGSLAELVDSAIQNLAVPLQRQCNPQAILAALRDVGACDSACLGVMLEHDYAATKAAVGAAAPPYGGW